MALTLLGVTVAVAAATAVSHQTPTVGAGTDDVTLRREFRVPLDHTAPDLGTATIEIVFARPFDPELPTLLVVADGQQFYLLREGAMERLVRDRLGEGYNAVGVIGRGQLAAHCPRGELFLADDDHVLTRMKKAGVRRRLVSSFFAHGLEAPATRAVVADLEPLRWVE